jgi:hypothetical protein
MKNIFVSYKQSWVSNEELDYNLGYIRDNFNKLWFKSLIYYFDDNSDLPAKELDKRFLENIKKSDIFISFLNYSEKSEWQLLELWMAYSLWKRIILIVNNSIKDNYFLAYWTSNSIIYFDKLENLDFKKILW